MQMALVKVLHSKRNIGLPCRDTQNSSFAFAHLLQRPVTAALPSRQGYKSLFLQHSLNRSPISGECVIPEVQRAQFSCNKRKLGVIPPI